MKEITQVQQKYFDMFGFIIIRNVLSKSELKAIEEEYQLGFQKTLEHHSDSYGMRKQFNWSNLNEKYPNLCNLPSHPKILKTIKKLLGEKTFPFLCNSNNFNGPATEWHTDQNQDIDCFSVKVAFYLDELNQNNGALRFLPCSHKEPLNRELWDFGLYGSNKGSLDEYESKSGIPIDQVPSYHCITSPGDMIVFNLKIWHSSWGGKLNRRNVTINFSKYPESLKESESLKKLAIQSKQTMKSLNFPMPQFTNYWETLINNSPNKEWISNLEKFGFYENNFSPVGES